MYNVEVEGSIKIRMIVEVPASSAVDAMADAIAILEADGLAAIKKAVAASQLSVEIDPMSIRAAGATPLGAGQTSQEATVNEQASDFLPYQVQVYADAKKEQRVLAPEKSFGSQFLAEAYAEALVSPSGKFALAEVIEYPEAYSPGESQGMRVAAYSGTSRGGWEIHVLREGETDAKVMKTYLSERRARTYLKRLLLQEIERADASSSSQPKVKALLLVDNSVGSDAVTRQRVEIPGVDN